MMVKKAIKKQYFWLISLLVFVTIGILFYLKPVLAGILPDADDITQAVIWVIEPIVRFIGRLLITMTHILVAIASYKDFINATAVNTGWVVVRDVCNMFFVLILIIIAFATILKIETYQYKRLLAKLLIAAVLINFSKVICGLLIDLAQVVMMQFVTAFSNAAEGNFASAFGLNEMMALSRAEGGGIDYTDASEILIAYVLAGIMSLVALVVVTVVCVILLLRIVALWFLIVLSPLAYILQILPMTQKHAQQWWSKFSNEVIVGPVLAFFLWLALSVTGSHTGGGLSSELKLPLPSDQIADPDQMTGLAGATQTAITSIGNSESILGFILATLMFVYGLTLAQQMSTLGGGLAGSAVGKMKSWGTKAAKGLVAGAALGVGARYVARPAAHFAHGVARGLTFPLTKLGKPGKAVANVLRMPTGIAAGWSSDFAKGYQDKKVKKRQAAMEKIGMGQGAMTAISEGLGPVQEHGLELPGRLVRWTGMKIGAGRGGFRGWAGGGVAAFGEALMGLGGLPFGTTLGAAKRGIAEAKLLQGRKDDIKEAARPGGARLAAAPREWFTNAAFEVNKSGQEIFDGLNFAEIDTLFNYLNDAISGAPTPEGRATAQSNMDGFLHAVKSASDDGKAEYAGAVSWVNMNAGVNTGTGKTVASLKPRKIMSLAGIDQEKFTRTQRLMNEKGENWNLDPEYNQNRGQYYSPEQMELFAGQARERQKFDQNWLQPEGYNENKVMVLGGHASKEGVEQRPIAIADFKASGSSVGKLAKEFAMTDDAGANLTGEQKNKMAAAIAEDVYAQGLADNQEAFNDPSKIKDVFKNDAKKILFKRKGLDWDETSDKDKEKIWQESSDDIKRDVMRESIHNDALAVQENIEGQETLRMVNTGHKDFDLGYVDIHEEEHEPVAKMSVTDRKTEAERIRRENPELDQEVQKRWGHLEGDALDEELITEYRTKKRYTREVEAEGAVQGAASEARNSLKDINALTPEEEKSEAAWIRQVDPELALNTGVKFVSGERDKGLIAAYRQKHAGAAGPEKIIDGLAGQLQSGNTEGVIDSLTHLKKLINPNNQKAQSAIQGALDKVLDVQAGGPEAIEKLKKDSARKMRKEGYRRQKEQEEQHSDQYIEKLQGGVVEGKERSDEYVKGLRKEKPGITQRITDTRAGKFVAGRVTQAGRQVRREEELKRKIKERVDIETEYKRHRARARDLTEKIDGKDAEIKKVDISSPVGRVEAAKLIQEKNDLITKRNQERKKLATTKKNYEEAVVKEEKARGEVEGKTKPQKPAEGEARGAAGEQKPARPITPPDVKELQTASTPEERREFQQHVDSIRAEVDKDEIKKAFQEASTAIKLPGTAGDASSLLTNNMLLNNLYRSVRQLTIGMGKQNKSFGRLGANIEQLASIMKRLQGVKTSGARKAVLQSVGMKEADFKKAVEDLFGEHLG